MALVLFIAAEQFIDLHLGAVLKILYTKGIFALHPGAKYSRQEGNYPSMFHYEAMMPQKIHHVQHLM